jgi:hypothetical protein
MSGVKNIAVGQVNNMADMHNPVIKKGGFVMLKLDSSEFV